jgi:hypothetical protein
MKVFKDACKNCLLSNSSIVSPLRVKDMVSECSKDRTFFICHKSSSKGENTCCSRFYDVLKDLSQEIRVSEQLNCIEFVDQEEHEKLLTYQEMKPKN